MNNKYEIIEFVILDLRTFGSLFFVSRFFFMQIRKSVLLYNASNDRYASSVNLSLVANYCENLIARQLQLSV